jgi:chromosome segregation ATPase
MNLDEAREVIQEIQEEIIKERGKILNILDSDKVAKIQVHMKSEELKKKVEALTLALEVMEKYKKLEEELRRIRLGMGDDYGDDPVKVIDSLKEKIARLKADLYNSQTLG